jgi:hypothetical protein
MSNVRNRIKTIEKTLKAIRKPRTENSGPFITLEETYALVLEKLGQCESENLDEEHMTELLKMKDHIEKAAEADTGIDCGNSSVQEIFEQEEVKHFYSEAEAIRSVIKTVGLKKFKPLGQDIYHSRASDYPGYEKLYFQHQKEQQKTTESNKKAKK